MQVVLLNGSPDKGLIFTRYVGPYKVAHWLRKNGYTCQVLDFIAQFNEQQICKLINKFITPETLVLALSTTFMCLGKYKHSDGVIRSIPEEVLNALKRIKEEHPHIKIVSGGYKSDRLNGWGVVDATVMSYTTASEDILVEYLDFLRGKGEEPKYVLYMNGKTRKVYNEARTVKYNIEVDDFKFIPQDYILHGEALPLDVSRGCIFACRFCQYPHLGKGKMDYIRGMNLLEDEIRYNHETFGTTGYMILDDTFNDTQHKVSEFHKMTERLGFGIDYTAYLRAELIHRFPDTAHMLKESGLFGAYHGLESLHPYASKLVGKGWSGKHARDYIPKLYHEIWSRDVTMHTNFIVGLPKETKQDLMNTVQWHRDNKLHTLYFSALGLWNPDDKSHAYSIQSEFDRNAGKYGFSFGDDGWYNETWTQQEAQEFASHLNDITKVDKKCSVWSAPSMLWYGYTKTKLLEWVASVNMYNWVLDKTEKKYFEYYIRVTEDII